MNQLAKRILAEATGDEPKTEAPTKNKAAVELGRLGGQKGGVARKAALTPEQRSEIAKKAATKRWMPNSKPAGVIRTFGRVGTACRRQSLTIT